jgi:low affinity Fe/Cu permease
VTAQQPFRKEIEVESVNKRRQEKVAGAGFKETFRGFSKRTADLVGTPAAFLAAVGLIVVWAFSGPSFHFSDTWQLVINTGTTIITFLMVFLIQNTQNRDSRAIHLKLDELIKALGGARNSVIDLDRLSDEQLKTLEDQYKKLCTGGAAQKR